ncbi:MAG: hypothetical protein V4558_16525 [Gemmatimonadota bacterium]
MYSTCLYCTRSLGTNEVIETLPVGRRIAFDAAQGRLWVVCRHCAKWNLVPFDTRLESIDAGERLFRDTRVRFSTDNIGIARLKEGLELVRIGPALRPEFAAWRYGDQFGRRRKRALAVGAGAAVLSGGIFAGGLVAGASLALVPMLLYASNSLVRGRRVVLRVPRSEGAPIELTRNQVDQLRIQWRPDRTWGVRTHWGGRDEFGYASARTPSPNRLMTGRDAEVLLASALAHANRWVGDRNEVRGAVDLLDDRGTSRRIIELLPAEFRFAHIVELRRIPGEMRLAMEMGFHEESEREALAGELTMLEWQWKEADRLAKISDGLAMQTEG